MAATCWTCQDDAEGRHCSTVPQSRLCHFARVESCLCLSTLPSCHAGEQNSGTQQWRLCCMPRSCSYCRGCSLSVIRSKVWGGHLIEGTTSLTHGLSQKPHVLELGGSVLLCRLKHGSYAAHRPSTIWADQIPSNEVRPVQLRRRLSRWSRCWCSAGLV